MIRPKGFEHEKLDCVVRALSLAGNVPYKEVHTVLKKHGRKDAHLTYTGRMNMQSILKDLGLKAKSVKRNGSVEKFLRLFPKGNYFVMKSSHAFAVLDGVAHDLRSEHSHVQEAWMIDKMIEGPK